ncbi:MAG: hypothetical protein IPF57_03905 [Gammaproteobacteria bacterium]|nr:hypothetical protein [Gammaproteobacteria bacterium]
MASQRQHRYRPRHPGTQTARLQADDQWDNISYVVSGNYSITDDVSVYLKFSTGYNAGGFSARDHGVGF